MSFIHARRPLAHAQKPMANAQKPMANARQPVADARQPGAGVVVGGPVAHAWRPLLTGEPVTGIWFDRTQEYAARRRGEDFKRRTMQHLTQSRFLRSLADRISLRISRINASRRSPTRSRRRRRYGLRNELGPKRAPMMRNRGALSADRLYDGYSGSNG
jgi:hypothetical protein